MSARTRILRFLRHWHARLGVLAALFFLYLATSGIALNHTYELQLDKKQVGTPWLMRWYGLHAAVPDQGYSFEHGYFTGDEQRWVMDGKLLEQASGQPVGAVETGGVRYLANRDTLYVYRPEGLLVDKMHGSTLPDSSIQRIGIERETKRILLQGPVGVYASEDGLDWRQATTENVAWSERQALPPDALVEIQPLYAPSLSMERVLLDFHSGRIMGERGTWVMDFAALALMVLSLSGLWIYFRSILKKRQG